MIICNVEKYNKEFYNSKELDSVLFHCNIDTNLIALDQCIENILDNNSRIVIPRREYEYNNESLINDLKILISKIILFHYNELSNELITNKINYTLEHKFDDFGTSIKIIFMIYVGKDDILHTDISYVIFS